LLYSSPDGEDLKEDTEQFLLQHDLMNYLYEPKKDWKSSMITLKPEIKFNDPSFLQTSNATLTLELLENVLEGKYLNGIQLGSNCQESSLADSVTLATQYATEIHHRKRLAA